MNIETVRRITLARHLYELGMASLRTANDMHLFSAVNLLQDAVEAFLIAVADHVNAGIDPNTKFDKYFVEINAKISPKELPFKGALMRLNRVRVNSKHYGIQPARDECDRLAVSVRQFFDEVSNSIFSASFSTVSAIDLLPDGDTKTVLLEAKKALESGDLVQCAINCRKAIYLEIEHRYDISQFKDGDVEGLLGAFSRAPHYAKNKQYIDENVENPTDFIVYDHSSVNERLLIEGVDNTAFWNVWRLTPKVYKPKDAEWVVEQDFAKLDEKVLGDKIDYIFSATLDVVLSIHRTRQATRWAERRPYYIDLAQDKVPVLSKADKNSKVVQYTPDGVTRLDANFVVTGLNGDGPYWHVAHFRDGFEVYGYIHNDYIKT
jgi:hypothetical protein